MLPDTSRNPLSFRCTNHAATLSPLLRHPNAIIGGHDRASACSDRRVTGHGGRVGGVVMMARANRQKTVEQRQKRLDKNAAPVVLSAKARRQANRARRAYYREKFACSGHRLIKLQEEDDSSFYIGFVGTNRAGRAQALKSVEVFLKKATEMKARAPLFPVCTRIIVIDTYHTLPGCCTVDAYCCRYMTSWFRHFPALVHS